MSSREMIKIGPIGRKNSGKKWELRSKKITQILIWYGENIINAIRFQFVKDGRLVLSNLHGCDTFANNFIAIKIDHPSEYIIELSGQWNDRCRSYNSSITSLIIRTNLQTYGPFGTHGSAGSHEKFQFQIGEEQQFGGFHGTADHSGGLRSIGVYLKLPTSLHQPKGSSADTTIRSAKTEEQ